MEEELFPSEIARLVLGYLKENKCEKSWKIFLEECSSLQEYCQLVKRGKFYPTNVNGKSLSDVLSEYCFLKKEAVNNDNNNEFMAIFQEKCKVILKEIITNAVEHALPKYIPCLCCNSHLKVNCPLNLEQRANNYIECGNEVEKNGQSNKHKENRAENNPHNCESNMESSVADCNSNHSGEQFDVVKVPGVTAVNHGIGLLESSLSDSVYLQEIIKVEKDNDNYSILENTPEKNMSNITCNHLNSAELTDVCPKSAYNLRSTEKKVKIVENSTAADSASKNNEESDSMEVEFIKTVKPEPNFNNFNMNKTADANCFQNTTSVIKTQCNGSSTVEISQTSLCNIQSTVDQVDDLSSISSSNNQPGYTLQANPFSSQPVAVNDLSFSTVPTYIVPSYSSNGSFLQNNAQCSIVINAPAALTGFPLTLPSIPPNSLGPVLTSIETIRNDNTSSVPTVCVSNALSPVLTAVDPVMSKNMPSVSGISANAVSNPVMTTMNTAAIGGQTLTVSGLPANVSSSVRNPANTTHAISTSCLITSDNGVSKASGKLANKRTYNKKTNKRKITSDLYKEKGTELQSNIKLKKGKLTYSQQHNQLLQSPSSLLGSEKKTASKNSNPGAYNPQVQCGHIQPKMNTRRKGK